jgi:AcrR family transcriptional regulator
MLSRVSRWEPHARERLEQAALELFTEQGFGQTSVPQITARAGLTTRTFFRHFVDKREVLFAHEADFPEIVARLMTQTPPSLSPMQLIADGLHAVAVLRFDGHRDILRIRHHVISTDAGLVEREMRKYAALAAAIADGLRHRGTDELEATLTADIAVTVLRVAVTRWLRQTEDRPLTELLDQTLNALASVTCERPDRTSQPRRRSIQGVNERD